MDLFQWDQNYEAGVPEIDRQHRHLVDIINQFGSLVLQNKLEQDDLEGIFKKLISYTELHFQEEEGLMQKYAIDPRHQVHHVREHASFLQEINFMRKDLSFREGGSGHSLLQFLNNWLAYHLLGSDKSLFQQIVQVEKGESAERAFDMQKAEANPSTQALLNALNHLFQQISDRNRRLVEMNWTLEEKVAERTLALSEANRNLEALALTDVLTNLPNRRYAMRRLSHFWQQSQEEQTSLSCMMIDADGFKFINDSFGHTAGDTVLYALARCMREAVRNDDIVCRLGGDEFLVICPRTPLEGALRVAELLRKTVSELRVPVVDGEWKGSISIGVASRKETMRSPDDLIKMADKGVYAAKHAGRNCVCTTETLKKRSKRNKKNAPPNHSESN